MVTDVLLDLVLHAGCVARLCMELRLEVIVAVVLCRGHTRCDAPAHEIACSPASTDAFQQKAVFGA